MKGKFIAIEGIDFSGKTTQAIRLLKFLEQNGMSVVQTREPGGTPLGESMRDLILSAKSDDPAKEAILLLFMASRAENISKIINPALSAGKVVICDRFLASTIAYQGVLSGFTRASIVIAHELFNFGLYPDLTIILDIKPETAMQRREAALSERHNNKYDFLPLESMQRIRDSFLSMVSIKKMNAYVVNAERSEDEVFEDIKLIASKFLKII